MAPAPADAPRAAPSKGSPAPPATIGATTPVPELPAGWAEKVDAKSGRKYYYNKDTKETKWSAPTTPHPEPTPTSDTHAPAKAEPAATVAQATPASEPHPPPRVPVADNAARTPDPEAAPSHAGLTVTPGDSTPIDQASIAEPFAPTPEAPPSEEPAVPQEEPHARSDPADDLRADEDAVQTLIAAAGAALPTRNPLLLASNDVLLRMLGSDADNMSSSSTNPGVLRRASLAVGGHGQQHHPSSTLLLVLRRMNVEYRSASLELRDAFEEAMAAKRGAFAGYISLLKAQHAELIRDRYQQLERERRAAAALAEELDSGARDATAETEAAIRIIEERLFGTGGQSPTSAGAASATERRLLSFWKSKYQTLCGQLEEAEVGLDRDRRLLADLEQASAVDPSGFIARVAAVRERVQEARAKCDAASTAYELECRKRGIRPQNAQQLSDAQLAAAAPAGSPFASAGASSPDKETTDAGSVGVGGGDLGDYFLTDMGHRDGKVRAATANYYAKKEEADDLATQCEELRQRVERSTGELHGVLDRFAETVGKLTTTSASFYEEIVQLLSQLEAREEEKFNATSAASAEAVRHATEVAALRHRLSEIKLRREVQQERHRRLLREKDVDLFRTRRIVTRGSAVEFTDFTDAPTVDIKLHLNVLKAKLAVTDSEKQLLRHQLHRVSSAAVETERELASKLSEQPSFQ
jgi:hypothetical protein